MCARHANVASIIREHGAVKALENIFTIEMNKSIVRKAKPHPRWGFSSSTIRLVSSPESTKWIVRRSRLSHHRNDFAGKYSEAIPFGRDDEGPVITSGRTAWIEKPLRIYETLTSL
jgi:hypothetical protein